MTVASLATIDALNALDQADAGHDPGARRLVVVHAVRRVHAELEEGTPRVDQAVDPFAHRQLAALAVAGNAALVTAGTVASQSLGASAQVVDQRRAWPLRWRGIPRTPGLSSSAERPSPRLSPGLSDPRGE